MDKQRPVISVRNLSKKFKITKDRGDSFKETFVNVFSRKESSTFYAVKDVSFDVYSGEFLGIIGKNGSGKSTLLQTIVGIYRQDAGTVKIKGKIVPFLQLGVGFNPRLPARSNIFLNGVILGMTRKEIKKRFKKIVRFAGIRRFLDTPIRNFSSGMKVRLAFAIAIQTRGDIYLLDEVLSVGDARFRKKSIKKMEELVQKDKTIVYVSHSMPSIKKYCDRVIWLDDGEIKAIGEPEEVISKYLKDSGVEESDVEDETDDPGID